MFCYLCRNVLISKHVYVEIEISETAKIILLHCQNRIFYSLLSSIFLITHSYISNIGLVIIIICDKVFTVLRKNEFYLSNVRLCTATIITKYGNIWCCDYTFFHKPATEAVAQSYSGKQVFLNFAKFTRKHLCQSLFFNKVSLNPCLSKKIINVFISCISI